MISSAIFVWRVDFSIYFKFSFLHGFALCNIVFVISFKKEFIDEMTLVFISHGIYGILL